MTLQIGQSQFLRWLLEEEAWRAHSGWAHAAFKCLGWGRSVFTVRSKWAALQMVMQVLKPPVLNSLCWRGIYSKKQYWIPLIFEPKSQIWIDPSSCAQVDTATIAFTGKWSFLLILRAHASYHWYDWWKFCVLFIRFILGAGKALSVVIPAWEAATLLPTTIS